MTGCDGEGIWCKKKVLDVAGKEGSLKGKKVRSSLTPTTSISILLDSTNDALSNSLSKPPPSSLPPRRDETRDP